MMKSRSFWLSLVLLGVFPLVTRGWMDADRSRRLYLDAGRLHQEDSRRFEVTRRKDQEHSKVADTLKAASRDPVPGTPCLSKAFVEGNQNTMN